MMEDIRPGRRLFVGSFMKSLRAAHGLRQVELALALAISPPYLSQLESDSRPLTPRLARRIRELFPTDWADMARAPPETLIDNLIEAARDPVLRDTLPQDQIERIAEQHPAFAKQFLRLYQLYRSNAHKLEAIDEALGSDTLSGGRLPWEEVRDWFNQADNYIDLIDVAAEKIGTALSREHSSPETRQLEDWFAQRGITLSMEPASLIRSYDESRQVLVLDVNQPLESLRFQMAFQICAIALAREIEHTVDGSHLLMPTSRHLLTVGLTNYAAGALLMPYRPFRDAARRLRHDVDRLRKIFSVSFEQAAHRLSTLQRPHARGTPVFFCKIDMGGNITKRHAANGLQLARFSGACPLWIAHEAVSTPEKIHLQVADMAESGRYVFLARGQLKPADSFFVPPRRHALVLGWETTLAKDFVYSDTLNLTCEEAVTRMGISCRICPRMDCQQRAYPPNDKQISIDTRRRGLIPYDICD